MVGLKPDFGSPVKQRAVLMSAVQVLFELGRIQSPSRVSLTLLSGCLPTEGRACAAAVVSNVDAFALQVPEEVLTGLRLAIHTHALRCCYSSCSELCSRRYSQLGAVLESS